MTPTWADPILNCEESSLFEAKLFAGNIAKIKQAMLAVGTKIGRSVLEDFEELKPLPKKPKVLLLVGNGHNGGDALVAGREILNRVADADIAIGKVGELSQAKPLVQEMWEAIKNHCRLVSLEEVKKEKWHIVLDGILGLGFKGALKADLKDWVRTINEHKKIDFRAAIDVPSGFEFQADFTYVAGTFKRELLDPKVREICGRLRYINVGFFEGQRKHFENCSELITTESILDPLKKLRKSQSDKRSFGRIGIVAGSSEYPGAAILCAEGALKSGAGVVTVFCSEEVYEIGVKALPEAIWVNRKDEPKKVIKAQLERCVLLTLGCGLGESKSSQSVIKTCLSLWKGKMVLDASALRETFLKDIGPERDIIVTPHAGEYKKIEKLLKKKNWVTLLKGGVTTINQAGKQYHIIQGGPILARGGSGDLLSGVIGSVWGQLDGTGLEAAVRGGMWMGMAADKAARDFGQINVKTTEIINYLGKVLREDESNES